MRIIARVSKVISSISAIYRGKQRGWNARKRVFSRVQVLLLIYTVYIKMRGKVRNYADAYYNTGVDFLSGRLDVNRRE